jgi:hypothetical protein
MRLWNNITQTLSAESGAKNYTYPQTSLKEFNSTFDSQACAYYPKLTEGEIGQQSADQLLWFHINPVEFDKIRMQAELWNHELKPEELQ